VKGRISRGQQKLLIAAFVLAQCRLILAARGLAPVLLVDDFSAELSVEFQRRLLGALLSYPGQKFVAALEREGPLREAAECRVFHVEHGGLQAL
jgi:DNA replication and repair protein RecF